MRAKCPHCNDGCERCDYRGVVYEITCKSGTLYTRACLNPDCGYKNGGSITDGPPPEVTLWEPGPCVMCGKYVEWELVGTV